IFSPLIILTLLFTPYVSNLLSLITLSFAGLGGTYFFLRSRSNSKPISAGCALLFVNCNWFGLHFTEGHITFRSFLILPLFFALAGSKRPRMLICAIGILSFFLLDGGIYAFIFAIITFGISLLVDFRRAGELIKIIRSNQKSFILAGLAFICCVFPKIHPVLLEHTRRMPIADYYVLSLQELFRVFFYPLQHNKWQSTGAIWRFHEYGCYLGFTSVLLVIFRLVQKKFVQQHWRDVFLMFFCFVVATGIFIGFNPWLLFQKIPLINNAHVQSRFFIVFMVFFIGLLAHSLDSFSNKIIALVLLCMMNIEFIAVKIYPATHMFQTNFNKTSMSHLIKKTTIEKTVEYLQKPDVYFDPGVASKQCYEPAAPRTNVITVDNPKYRGET
ncbi:MAG: hypothetical protein AAB740_00400, partial [Patescibacteria group bacterium]